MPTRRVFASVYRTLRYTGTLADVRTTAEQEVCQDVDEEERIFQTVERSTRGNTRSFYIPQTRVCRILRAYGVYPYHVQ